MEHPADAESWNMEGSKFPGTFDVALHRRRTGLAILDEFGNHAGLAKKPTRFRSANRYATEQLDMKCACSAPRANLHGVLFLKAQNYGKRLERLWTKAILKDTCDATGAYITEEVEPNQDDAESKDF